MDPGDLRNPRYPWRLTTPGTQELKGSQGPHGPLGTSGPHGSYAKTPVYPRDTRNPPRDPRGTAGGPSEPIVDPRDLRELTQASWIDFMIIIVSYVSLQNHDFRVVMKFDIYDQETSGNLLGHL